MRDLVDRLRKEDPECGLRHSLAMEAADRIELLEAAMQEIAQWKDADLWRVNARYLRNCARYALAERKRHGQAE